MSRLDRTQILAMIPHGGAMCLLDEVVDWDGETVTCISGRYAAPDNPLRRADGTLGAAAGIEIAAQAMAVHGRLTAAQAGPPVPGYLISLRDVRLGSAVLAAQAGTLLIRATRLTQLAGGAAYQFTITAQHTELLSGRAVVQFGETP